MYNMKHCFNCSRGGHVQCYSVFVDVQRVRDVMMQQHPHYTRRDVDNQIRLQMIDVNR